MHQSGAVSAHLLRVSVPKVPTAGRLRRLLIWILTGAVAPPLVHRYFCPLFGTQSLSSGIDVFVRLVGSSVSGCVGAAVRSHLDSDRP